MAKVNKVPAIRFKGFSDVWAESNFLDNIEKIIDFRGRTPKKLGLDWSESGYLALSALNVKSGYIDKKVDAHYGNQELYDKWMLGNELHKNQVLFTTEAPMGNVAQIPDDEKYILSQRTIAFDVKPSLLAEDFLAIVLGSPKTFKKLTSMSSGGTAKGVSQKSLATLDITIPSDTTEQTQIGSYFQHLDRLISFHQAKVNKLNNLKKAMLEKMFPKQDANVPEIRFKGFAGAWEESKLGDLMNVTSVKRIHQSDWTNSGVRFLRARDLVASFKNEEVNEYLYISKEKYDEYSAMSGKVKPEDLLVTGVGTIGIPFLIIDETPIYFKDGNIIWFQNDKKLDGYFFFYSFTGGAIQSFIKDSAGTGTVGTFTIDSGKKTPIKFPEENEQRKIGAYFKSLDSLINLHQTQLEKLGNLKKACLEKMFV